MTQEVKSAIRDLFLFISGTILIYRTAFLLAGLEF